MQLLVSLLILGGFVFLVVRFWGRYWEDKPNRNQALLGWVTKGLLLPILVWMLLSGGIMGRPSPWTAPTGASVPGGVSKAQVSFKSMVPVSLVVGSYWAAASFGWLVAVCGLGTESRRGIR